jgi:hypothetical protein
MINLKNELKSHSEITIVKKINFERQRYYTYSLFFVWLFLEEV